MAFLKTFHLWPFLDTAISYLTAFILGTVINYCIIPSYANREQAMLLDQEPPVFMLDELIDFDEPPPSPSQRVHGR